jgi:hypothetical protein
MMCVQSKVLAIQISMQCNVSRPVGHLTLIVIMIYLTEKNEYGNKHMHRKINCIIVSQYAAVRSFC